MEEKAFQRCKASQRFLQCNLTLRKCMYPEILVYHLVYASFLDFCPLEGSGAESFFGPFTFILQHWSCIYLLVLYHSDQLVDADWNKLWTFVMFSWCTAKKCLCFRGRVRYFTWMDWNCCNLSNTCNLNWNFGSEVCPTACCHNEIFRLASLSTCSFPKNIGITFKNIRDRSGLILPLCTCWCSRKPDGCIL